MTTVIDQILNRERRRAKRERQPSLWNTLRLCFAAILFVVAARLTPDTPEGLELLMKIGRAAE